MRPAVWLWATLVFPSLFVVGKYLGWTGIVAYAAAAALGVGVAARAPGPRSARATLGLAVATVAIVVVVFIVMYPRVNVQTPGAGSDDDDAYNVGARALLMWQSPYSQTTYLGNVLHQLPGSFLLAVPFVLLGTSAWQNLFWLTAFFLAVGAEIRDGPATLRLAWLVLLFSPTVLHQVVTGTGHAANTIYVLLGLWWLVRSAHKDLAAVGWGVALASRANFLFLVPLAWGWLRQHDGPVVAARATAVTVTTVAALTLPFYFHDPQHFGPLEAVDRVTRFNALWAYLGALLTAAPAGLALVLAYRPMMTVAVLFRNCALVQAVVPVAGTLLSVAQSGKPDLEYAAYATFAMWFSLAAYAITQSARRDWVYANPSQLPP